MPQSRLCSSARKSLILIADYGYLTQMPRQLGNEATGSPATRARQPFFGEIFHQRRICLCHDKPF